MTINKSDITNNIAFELSISHKLAKNLLNNFINKIISHSDERSVKISNFGTFVRKFSPERIGRNPKTGQEYDISKRSQLRLIISGKTKEKIN
jgi:integration host factor subunit alpha